MLHHGVWELRIQMVLVGRCQAFGGKQFTQYLATVVKIINAVIPAHHNRMPCRVGRNRQHQSQGEPQKRCFHVCFLGYFQTC